MCLKRAFCTFGLAFFLGSAAALRAEETPAEPPTILFLGDSLTAGFGLEPDLAFPQRVAEKLEADGLPAEIVNAGLSGETTAGGLRRVNWLLRREIDILFLALGGNDALRALDPAQTEANLRGIFERVQTRYPEATLILAGMLAPPNLGAEYGEAFSAVYPRVAAEFDAAFVPFLLEGVAGDPRLNLPDGIHPNVEGHRRIAEVVYPAVKAALDPTPARENRQ